MSDKNAEQIKSFYTELSKIAPNQDWERILKTAKKILGLSVNEKKAFQTKIICLINLDKFDEALSSIERQNDADDLYFEKSYCLYRTNKVNEAYATLAKCQSPGVKEKELMAQINYRLEKYQEAYDTYRDIIKNADIGDEFEIERMTNLSAVVANLKGTKDFDMSDNENKTFELQYNSACISISKGQWAEAQEKLEKAETMCNETFKEEDPDDLDGLEREVSVIRAQLAFCLQKMGQAESSIKLYTKVLKSKKADMAVTACISNNLVCVNRDGNVFDSKKRIKVATATELEQKLTSGQRSVIAYNEILFCLITNQNDSVQKLLKKYETGFNERERFSLLKMAQLCKEKKFAEAEKLLIELTKGSCSDTVLYYLLQIYLTQGKFDEAILFVKTLEDYKNFKLGITSASIALLSSKGKNADITKLFENAINYYTKLNPDKTNLKLLLKENSNYQLKIGNLQTACDMLEKLRSMNPEDFKILSKLINIYSKFDSEKANNLSKELPSLEDIMANSALDLDTLESQFSLLSSKYSKLLKSGGSGSLIKSPDAKLKSGDSKMIEKKKKKRKVRLPKNMDPKAVIDQERWVPLKERSYYRGRRNKKKGALGKGTQGAVGKDITPTSPKAAEVSTPVPTPQPEKVKPKAAAKAKPKKKGKGGW